MTSTDKRARNLERANDARRVSAATLRAALDDRIAAAAPLCQTPKDIAHRLGVRLERVKEGLAAKGIALGLPTIDREAERRRIAKMFAEGQRVLEIGRAINRSTSFVYATLEELKLRRREARGAYAPRSQRDPLGDEESSRMWRDAKAAWQDHLDDLKAAYPGLMLTSLSIPQGYGIRVSQIYGIVFSASPFATVAELGERC